MLCGHHLETKRGGIWDASPGGVAVLIKKGWAAKVVKPDKNDANAEMLWQSTRFVHVHVATGKGRTAINIISCYGIPSNNVKNAELFTLITKYIKKLGNTPLLLAGDYNFDLDDQEQYPVAILNEVIMKRLIDVDKMMAEVTSTATQASYHNGSVRTKPTRIDGILVNQSFAAAIKNVSTVQDTGIPGHRPLVVRTDMAHPLQWVNKSKVLPKIKLQHDVDDLEKVLLPHLQK